MLSALLATLALAAGEYTVVPRVGTAGELAGAFDDGWTVPRATTPERAAGVRDLVRELAELSRARFEPTGAGEFGDARTLGDVVARFDRVRGEREATLELLGLLERERPDVWRAAGWALPQLVDEAYFLGESWDPDRDRDDDGFLVAPQRSLETCSNARLASGRGRRSLVQVATLMRADLWAAKQCEADFRAWLERPDVDYERVRPRPGTYLVDRIEGPRREARLRVGFRTDLPFPFSHYDCELDMRHRLDEDGHLVSDVAAVGDDFYWLAGQDVYLPLERSSGEFVAMLYVRVFGTDLRGVPDKPSHHEAGCRQAMGCLKRDAERLWAASERQPLVRGSVPAFDVRGRE